MTLATTAAHYRKCFYELQFQIVKFLTFLKFNSNFLLFQSAAGSHSCLKKISRSIFWPTVRSGIFDQA